ncbi:MAG: two-component regulator propeller domain-containing protein [Bacteroidota bacterium]
MFNHYQSYRKSLWVLLFMFPGLLLYSSDRGVYSNLQFEQITSIQGLTNNTVLDIVQDQEGFIWIATSVGLNRFDGYTIKSYYREEISGLPGNTIGCLLVSERGSLFVGTQTGACVYDKTTDSFIELLFQQESLDNADCIIQLTSGDVVISTSTGLYRVNENLEIRQLGDHQDIRRLCEFRTGIIWALESEGILVLNTDGEMSRRYSNSIGNVGDFDMSSENIECMFKDSGGKVWLGTKRDGVGYYDPSTDRFYSLKLPQGVNPIEDNFVRDIHEDMNGCLWIGTESGLYIYNPVSEVFQFYGQNFNPFEKGLNDKAIYSIFRSRDNLMWIGTYFGGANYTSLKPKVFFKTYADGGREGLSGNAVSEMIEAKDGKLWIATEDGGITILDRREKTFSYLKNIPGDPSSLSSNNVHALEEDAEGNIWIGTFIGGLHRYNAKDGSIERIELVLPAELEENVYSKSLFSIHIDSQERTWVGSIEGLYMKEKNDNDFKTWGSDFFSGIFVHDVEEDPRGNIWVCSKGEGFYRIDQGMEITHYRMSSDRDIRSNRIIFSYFDRRGEAWFGTMEGGLLRYDYSRDHFTTYTVEEGLPDNTVYAITEDSSGMLWISTGRGLSMFDPVTGEFVNFTENDGLIGNQFNFNSALSASDGTLYFGAVNGLTYFDPAALEDMVYRPVVHFTDFKLSNRSLRIGEADILSTCIDFQDDIRLRHKHKVLTFEYVALNYISPGNTEYAFYLEGLEEGWNYVGNQRSATYTNLSQGYYVFHLKASGGGGAWPDEERTISLYMKPPFWLSVWGFALYGIILVAATLLSIRLYTIRQREILNVRLARVEKEKNEEISKHRLNFFTYISHEFKTPLTLIIATLEHLMNYEQLLPVAKDYGILMRKNAVRLLVLINQLMDFRKIETDHARIKYNKGDVVTFLRSTFESFQPLLEKSSVKGVFTSNISSYIVYFDADKLEKILSNLISNSCKSFTKPGEIGMDVKILAKGHLASPTGEITGDLIITVTDNGPGILPDKLKYLFEPFTLSESGEFPGSGIGLALVKSLVNYLGGKIIISTPQEGGTMAVVQLPLVQNPSPELIQDEQFIERHSTVNLQYTLLDLESEPEVEFDLADYTSSTKYELLIVEDNTELASLLKHHFSGIFKVSIAGDGAKALKWIKKNQPDLIISDIMMPEMDGFTLCNAVKDSIETSHIPVVLLTSKADAESREEGLFRGADVYLSKPFKLKELDLQVRNILRSREILRSHLSGFEKFPEGVEQLGNRDQMFIKHLTETVRRRLDDNGLDVEMLCSEANVSRSLLHTKLKKLTGLNTTGFIRKIRLDEAYRLIQENRLSVSEISYKVGFYDPSHFCKSFKKMFGKNPSEMY